MGYENRHVLREGRIVLYTRNGRPTFHARLSVDGIDGYIVKSTKKTSLDEAKRVAEELYDDFRYKMRHGLEIGTHTFSSLWQRWQQAHRHSLSVHRLKYIEGTLNRYLLPFLGGHHVALISDKMIADYWDWRIGYWNSPDGKAKIESAQKTRTTKKRPYKQKLGNVAKVPAQKSLSMEQAVLRQLFGWAARHGIITHMPLIKAPKLKSGNQVSRRPAFDLDEWRSLYRYLRKWAAEGNNGDPAEDGGNGMHRWHRQLLRNYVLFMCASGLRPNEARQLRWRDIDFHEDDQGTRHAVLHVSPETKTGERECIPLRNATVVLERIREASNHTKPNDIIFSDQNGRAIENFGKTFKKVLNQSELLKDRFGKERTVYSLRHTYATFRLLYGKVPIEDLAANMGTSPATIFAHYRHVTTRQKAQILGGSLRPELSRKGLYL